MAKEIIFNEKARAMIKEGIDIVADAVRVTIGPYGRNVALAQGFGGPMITNDGVTIARDISLKDPFRQMGVDIVKEVASKTNDLAGDGTSTSVVLTQALIEEGIKQIDKGVNSLSIRSGMNKAHEQAKEFLKEMRREVKGSEEIANVAIVSAESKELGEKIAETVEKVGKDGVITVEESQSFGIESEVVEGLEIDRGYISPYMMTNAERLEAEYKDVPVLITDKKISAVKDILPLLEKLAQGGQKDLVIIAEDVDGEALTTFVLNKLRGTFNVLAIKAPGYGEKKKEVLEDIATTIGAKVVSSDTGMNLELSETSVLGKATKIVSKKDATVIVGTSENKGEVDSRIESLKKQADQTDSKLEKERINERIAKLSGGVAVIRVGAATETEMKYLKLKIEDAVNATKAAIEEGIVMGGGSALTHVAKKMSESKASFSWIDSFEEKGYDIVVSALESPLKNIVENALGKGEGVAIVRQVQKGSDVCGYDAVKKEVVDDMFKAGIIDPVKVTRSGLLHAVSTAGIFLTTEVAIVDIPEEGTKPHPSLGGGMF